MKRRTLALFLAALMALSLTACGGSSSESVPAEQAVLDSAKTLSVGETAKTDLAEFTLNKCEFATILGLDYSDWLQPTYSKGLSSGSDKIYVYLSYTVKNLAKEQASGFDFTNIVVDYNEGYLYEDGVFANIPKYSSKAGVSEVGMASIDPLAESTIWGGIKCIAEAREHKDAIKIIVTLPSSSGPQEVAYSMGDGSGTQSDAAFALVECLDVALKNLDFTERNAGGVNGNGSRKFADEFVNELSGWKDPLDEEALYADIPELQPKLEVISSNIQTVVDLLIDMGQTNSDANVPQIKSLCTETINLITNLMGTELSGY